MKNFNDDSIFLNDETSDIIYSSFAKDLPIADYSNNFTCKQVFETVYTNIFELWIKCDQEKLDIMRYNGVAESHITGNASDYEKFRCFCAIMPNIIGSSTYLQAHLELKNFIGFSGAIGPYTCDYIWEISNETLENSSFIDVAKRIRNLDTIGLKISPSELEKYADLIDSEELTTPILSLSSAVDPDNESFDNEINLLIQENDYSIVNDSLSTIKESIKKRLEKAERIGCKAAYIEMKSFPSEKSTVLKNINEELDNLRKNKENSSEIYTTHMLQNSLVVF